MVVAIADLPTKFPHIVVFHDAASGVLIGLSRRSSYDSLW